MLSVAELVARVAAQPAVQVTHEVSVHGPTLQALLHAKPYMTLAEMMAHPDQHEERREFRYGHVLGSGLSQAEISEWQGTLPLHRLPEDVVEALAVVNGVHVWADLAVGRAYFGVAPLDEWTDFAELGWSLAVPHRASLVISYHDNGDYFLVLDTDAGRYAWFDHEDIDNPITVGRSFSEMLGWFWDHAQSLSPA